MVSIGVCGSVRLGKVGYLDPTTHILIDVASRGPCMATVCQLSMSSSKSELMCYRKKRWGYGLGMAGYLVHS